MFGSIVCDLPAALHEVSIKDPRASYCTHARGALVAFVQLGRSWCTFLRSCYIFLPSCLFATFLQFGFYDPSSSAAKFLSPKFVAMSLYYCVVFLAAVRPFNYCHALCRAVYTHFNRRPKGENHVRVTSRHCRLCCPFSRGLQAIGRHALRNS